MIQLFHRSKYQYIVIGLAILLTIGACKEDRVGEAFKQPDDSTKVSNEPPNIIFLLTDDQRFNALSFAGNTVLNTPNMDKLAQNGVYFKNAYVTTSICAMSRASILTGQYARKHDIWDFGESLTPEQYENTYPAVLKRAGYTTAFIGKFGVGNIQKETIDKYFDFWGGFNGQGSYNSTEDGQPIHLTAKMGNQALAFLTAQKDAQQPFLLSMSFKAPHVQDGGAGFIPDKAYEALYQSDVVEKPVAAQEEYFDYFPAEFIANENGAKNVARKRWYNRFETDEDYQQNIKKYYQLVYGVDVVIGKIMEKLEEIGQSRNTVIVFTSDNGFYLGEYGFAGKWYGSDASIRVPMIIFDPRNGAPRGKIVDNMALNIDIAPTIVSIAGADKPQVMQGEDLTPLMEGTASNWRTEFLYEHLWPSSDAYYIPSTEGVVTEDHKYMKYFLNRDFDNVMFEELYDREADKNELENRIGDADFEEIANQMKQKLAALREKAGKVE
ncbi:MAG: sulfatase [Bacteroidota bacterium]